MLQMSQKYLNNAVLWNKSRAVWYKFIDVSVEPTALKDTLSSSQSDLYHSVWEVDLLCTFDLFRDRINTVEIKMVKVSEARRLVQERGMDAFCNVIEWLGRSLSGLISQIPW
jgi:hypothetical protein